MKRKNYEKPVIVVEDFTLSQCVAACSPSLLVKSADTNCLPEDIKFFIEGTNYFSGELNCTDDADKDLGLNDLYCYHTLSENNTVFGS